MPQERKRGADLQEQVTAVLAGGALSMGMELALLAICAVLMTKGILEQEQGSGGAICSAFLSVLTGGGYAVLTLRHRALPVGIATALVWLILWTGLSLLLGANGAPVFHGSVALSGILGGCTAGFLGALRKKKRK